MREEVKEFLNNHDQLVIVLDCPSSTNVLYEWTTFQNPAKLFFNAFIIRFCKYLPLRLKNSLLRRLLGIKVGRNVGICPEVDFDMFFPQLISIGDNTIIGWKVHILCHEFTQRQIRLGRVRIGENSVIGAFSTIRAGITIGKNSIVAMHSFANKNVPDGEVWGGIPARKIRDTDLKKIT